MSDRDSSNCLPIVPDRNADPIRAKRISSTTLKQARVPREQRVSPVRLAAREDVAHAIRSELAEAGLTREQCSTAIGISAEIVGAYANPRAQSRSLQLADVVAFHRAGHQRFAVGLLRRLLRELDASARRRGLTPLQHLQEVAQRLGDMAMATQGDDRQRIGGAVRAMIAALEEMLLDVDGAR